MLGHDVLQQPCKQRLKPTPWGRPPEGSWNQPRELIWHLLSPSPSVNEGPRSKNASILRSSQAKPWTGQVTWCISFLFSRILHVFFFFFKLSLRNQRCYLENGLHPVLKNLEKLVRDKDWMLGISEAFNIRLPSFRYMIYSGNMFQLGAKGSEGQGVIGWGIVEG